MDRGETRVAILEAEGDPAPQNGDAEDKPTGGNRRRGAKAPPKQEELTGEHVAELYIERRGNRSIVGNIYKGKVDNVLPGLEAAFVDIGLDKNGFLHADDIVMPGVEVARRGRAAARASASPSCSSPARRSSCRSMKDPLKTKGARLSMQLSIAGRYLVYVPQGEGVGVSRRLDDKERDRLRKEAAKLDLRRRRRDHPHRRPRRHARGLRARDQVPAQAARGAPEARRGDASRRRWSSRRPTSRCASCATSSPAQFESAIVDDEKQHHRLESVLHAHRAGAARPRRALQGRASRCSSASASRRRSSRRSTAGWTCPRGGYLIIDYAEAMTVIDINSGSFTGRGKGARLEDTITKTNLEAAEEVVRQLRLRDIGGIIVIDFIDMARARNRDAVLKTLRKALDEDRTKTYVMEISPLGLVEMTRQNVTDGVREILTKTVPDLRRRGRGAVRGDRGDRGRAQAARPGGRAPERRGVPDPGAPARVGAAGRQPRAGPLLEIEARDRQALPLRGLRGRCRSTTSRSSLEGTREEVEERALPFREGEEVLVKIEEPHMYNEDDAVAKLDGYVISVAGGVKSSARSTLVRIEKVGRSSAARPRSSTVEAEADADGAAPSRGAAPKRAVAGAAGAGGGRRRRQSTSTSRPESATGGQALA